MFRSGIVGGWEKKERITQPPHLSIYKAMTQSTLVQLMAICQRGNMSVNAESSHREAVRVGPTGSVI